jgi:DNA repair exonuclease SbcCD nuclease subunit
MKILLTGDLHLRFKRPRWRKDEDYLDTQFTKLSQIFSIYRKEKCKLLIQPGDFFDSVDVPWLVVRNAIWEIFGALGLHKICVVRGQHDLRYHSKKVANTPLSVLEASGVIDILDSSPVSPADYVSISYFL